MQHFAGVAYWTNSWTILESAVKTVSSPSWRVLTLTPTQRIIHFLLGYKSVFFTKPRLYQQHTPYHKRTA